MDGLMEPSDSSGRIEECAFGAPEMLGAILSVGLVSGAAQPANRRAAKALRIWREALCCAD